MRYLLMIPGPVEVPEDILESFSGQPVAHYGTEWRNLYLDTIKAVSKILGTRGMSFLIPGSGSLGLETAASTFCKDKKCLILHNGFFGERLVDILSTLSGEEVDVLRFGFGSPVDLEALKKKLNTNSYDIVFMTHVETSTGMLNPAREAAGIVKEQGALFFLDAISSAGIEELRMDEWGIDLVIAASQKGFESPPGLAIVSCREELLNRIIGSPTLSWYTDLRVWYEYFEKWNDWHPFPVTLPTNIVKAFAKSIEILSNEGISARIADQKESAERLHAAMGVLGLKNYVENGFSAHGLTSISTEDKFAAPELVNFLKKRMGIQIAGSLGALTNTVFRIGHMSREQRKVSNLISVVTGIALFMESKGLKADLKQALKKLLD
ncbi:MAG: alanine--glyoxylate aminotransferase family protein [Spirochaetota bacterium]